MNKESWQDTITSIHNKLFPSDTASESEALIIILFVYATASNLPVGE